MLKHIIKREILDNLMSLRFSLTLILVVIIMFVSAILFISDYKETRSAYTVNTQENLKQLEKTFETTKMPGTLWRVMSFSDQWVYKGISDLTFIADGYDKELPNAFTVRPFETTGPHTRLRTNPLLQPFENLDWSLIIGVIMSFAAIVLTFDAISGDRERGTLKFSVSNPVPRATILLGKYIGALVSLMTPLLIGILLNVIIIAIAGVVPMNASVYARIGIVSLFSLLYVASFASLGMFVSSVTRESSTSLIILLLSWAILVIVIPGIGGVIASRAVVIPSYGKAQSDARDAGERAKDEYLAQHPEMSGIAFGSGRWSPGENLAGPLSADLARDNMLYQYRTEMIRQVTAGQNVSRISPLGLYKNAVETIAGTGIGHYDSFMKQVKQYRDLLKDIMLDKYPLDPNKAYYSFDEFGKVMDKVEFKLNDFPEFHEKPIAMGDTAKAAVWDIFFLFLFSLIFFMGSVVAFLRYDVR
jgi:ABC-type transport system involved in multi-copper enzyme maturation permease subunit